MLATHTFCLDGPFDWYDPRTHPIIATWKGCLIVKIIHTAPSFKKDMMHNDAHIFAVPHLIEMSNELMQFSQARC